MRSINDAIRLQNSHIKLGTIYLAEARRRIGFGSVGLFAVSVLDGIGRATVLSNVGITLAPNSLAGHIVTWLLAFPPWVYAFVGIILAVLYFTWPAWHRVPAHVARAPLVSTAVSGSGNASSIVGDHNVVNQAHYGSTSAETPSAEELHAEAVRLARLTHADRLFADQTPLDLERLCRATTTLISQQRMRDFIGFWFVVSGIFGDLVQYPIELTVHLKITPELTDTLGLTSLEFEPKWLARLKIIPIGAPIVVYGKLRRAGSGQVVFESCELIL